MLKIVILTNKDLTSNLLFSRLFEEKIVKILAVVESSTIYKNKSPAISIFNLSKYMSLHYMTFLIFKNIIFKIREFLTFFIDWKYSILCRCRKNDIPIFSSNNFNSPKVIEIIKDSKPDLLIIRANQILSKKILMIPKFGTWCVHSSLLPSFKGIAGEFHAMRMGKSVGTSIFEVEEKLDEGKIIERVAINPSSDLLETIIKNNLAGSKLLLKTLTDYWINQSLNYKSKYDYNDSYYSWPTAFNHNEFKKSNLCLLSFRSFFLFMILIFSS